MTTSKASLPCTLSICPMAIVPLWLWPVEPLHCLHHHSPAAWSKDSRGANIIAKLLQRNWKIYCTSIRQQTIKQKRYKTDLQHSMDWMWTLSNVCRVVWSTCAKTPPSSLLWPPPTWTWTPSSPWSKCPALSGRLWCAMQYTGEQMQHSYHDHFLSFRELVSSGIRCGRLR